MQTKHRLIESFQCIKAFAIALAVLFFAFGPANLSSAHAQTGYVPNNKTHFNTINLSIDTPYDRWSGQCAGFAACLPPYLTVSDLPFDWRADVMIAAAAWTSVGTPFQFDTVNSVDPNLRVFDVFAPDTSTNPLRLARGEIRVVLGSTIPPEKRIENPDPLLGTITPAWTIPFSDGNHPSTAMAALIVLDDYSGTVSWSVGRLPNSNEYDLTTVITHELGHAIGLKDCYWLCDTDVMHWIVSPSSVKRELSEHDKDELRNRYITSPMAVPSQPILLSPSQNEINIDTQPFLKWVLIQGADLYYIEISKSPNFASWWQDVSSSPNHIFSTTLEPNTTYYWRVKAVSAGGDSIWSPHWQFTTSSMKPAAPSNLQVTVLSATEVILSWSPKFQDVTGFVIYDNGQFIATVTPDVTSLYLSNLFSNSSHCYMVNNYNAYGYSEFSNEVCMILTLRPGDTNGNERIDGVDYVIWLNHFGQSTLNGPADGDFNYTRLVDYADYEIWLENYTG